MIFKPRLTFEIEYSLSSWKYNSKIRPSNFYIWLIRIAGVVMTLIGVTMLIKFI